MYIAADLNLETGQLFRQYIAEISLNVTLNKNQPTNQSHIHIKGNFARRSEVCLQFLLTPNQQYKAIGKH